MFLMHIVLEFVDIKFSELMSLEFHEFDDALELGLKLLVFGVGFLRVFFDSFEGLNQHLRFKQESNTSG